MRRRPLRMPKISFLSYNAIDLPARLEAAPVEAGLRAQEMGILNDDVMIDVAPDRPCGTIRVKLVYAGKSLPIPADDPWAE
jgi:hypothetical protein